jgi:hypothetical protein
LVAGPPWESGRSEKDRDATDKATSKKMSRVTARISHLSFDALDAHAQSVFRAAVLGFAEDPDDPNEPGHEECMIFSPDGNQRILFIEVPDAKQIKNRLHLDVEPRRAPATPSSPGSSVSVQPRWRTAAGATDRAGSYSPTPRATSSASCETRPNAHPLPQTPDLPETCPAARHVGFH